VTRTKNYCKYETVLAADNKTNDPPERTQNICQLEKSESRRSKIWDGPTHRCTNNLGQSYLMRRNLGILKKKKNGGTSLMAKPVAKPYFKRQK
jgi:hypothetical protein